MIWKPDTCSCVLEYGSSNTAEEFVRALEVCPAHFGAGNAHDAVLGENQTKNRVITELLEAFPKAAATWSFDGTRKLVVAIKGLTAAEKTNIKAAIESKYPKVSIG